MTIDIDLATLRNPWGLMPDVVTAAADRVETELARLTQERQYAADPQEWAEYEQLAEKLTAAERELARLQKATDMIDLYEFRTRKADERAEAAESELARLREGLRPEPLARLFHETYERLAPDHGYKTREASAVPWEDVPEANKALMIATADGIARALLAEDTA